VHSSDATIARAMAFAKRLGKVAVLARVCDGFIGNRMFEEYSRQAFFMLDEGARPEQIDGALKRWGMAMGPLAVIDLPAATSPGPSASVARWSSPTVLTPEFLT
jgi:3-hydroxyacyl-CoA dehydrogenase